jgi:hypothetical protein
MSCDIHIERTPALTLAEWKAAVHGIDGVRLDATGASATNPKTGEVISIAGVDGDAQIRLDGRWLPCFRWRAGGSVVFRASADFSNPQSQLRKIARELAGKLNAEIRGGEGERYD